MANELYVPHLNYVRYYCISHLNVFVDDTYHVSKLIVAVHPPDGINVDCSVFFKHEIFNYFYGM